MFFGLFKLQPHCDPVLAVIGFFVYIASYCLAGLYLLWALAPTELLHYLGITYFPQRYWALVIPVYPCVFLIFLYTIVSAQAVILCPAFDKPVIYKDNKTNTSPDNCGGAIPPLRDLNILDVNTMLYD